MLHRAEKSLNSSSQHSVRDSLEGMHRRLGWVLGAATGALIANALAVVALVEAG